MVRAFISDTFFIYIILVMLMYFSSVMNFNAGLLLVTVVLSSFITANPSTSSTTGLQEQAT